MVLTEVQAKLFYDLWIPLLDFVNRKYKLCKEFYGMDSFETFRNYVSNQLTNNQRSDLFKPIFTQKDHFELYDSLYQIKIAYNIAKLSFLNKETLQSILYNILNKYYNYPNGYSMENVNELIKKTKNDLIREYDGNIGINIYTDILGKNIKKIELSHEGNKLFYYDKTNIEININNYKFIYKNKTLNIYKNNMIVQTLNINSYNNNEINIEFLKNKYFNKLNIIINFV